MIIMMSSKFRQMVMPRIAQPCPAPDLRKWINSLGPSRMNATSFRIVTDEQDTVAPSGNRRR